MKLWNKIFRNPSQKQVQSESAPQEEEEREKSYLMIYYQAEREKEREKGTHKPHYNITVEEINEVLEALHLPEGVEVVPGNYIKIFFNDPITGQSGHPYFPPASLYNKVKQALLQAGYEAA